MICLGICCFVTLLTAVLGFLHLYCTFCITFAPGNVVCGVQTNFGESESLVWLPFDTSVFAKWPCFFLHAQLVKKSRVAILLFCNCFLLTCLNIFNFILLASKNQKAC